jgi:hypothetical protein
MLGTGAVSWVDGRRCLACSCGFDAVRVEYEELDGEGEVGGLGRYTSLGTGNLSLFESQDSALDGRVKLCMVRLSFG